MNGDAFSVTGMESALRQKETDGTAPLLGVNVDTWFWMLDLFAGRFGLGEGTSGLFLQICAHVSSCAHLTHRGVCVLWRVLSNFVLLCLHGKRPKANKETRVAVCFSLSLPEA